jgi:Delta7-sterol 5-desaturase
MRAPRFLRRSSLFAALSVAVVAAWFTSGIRLYRVASTAMAPSVRTGDYLLALEGPWRRLREPARFDLVLFDVPANSLPAAPEGGRWTRRIVGLPHEAVKFGRDGLEVDGRVVPTPFLRTTAISALDTAELRLGASEYFVLAENLDALAADSRALGPIKDAQIRGIVLRVMGTASQRPPWSGHAAVLASNLIMQGFFYFMAAGTGYAVVHVILRRWLAGRRIQTRMARAAEMRRDVFYSLSSVFIFAVVGVVTSQLTLMGWTNIYLRVDRYGVGYFWLSLGLMIVLHDTWFYWTHRLIHLPALFRFTHRVHHLSHTPTPWSALAFHPVEAVVQAAVFPLAALVLPMHPFVAVLWLTYMIVINVAGHLGFELLPAGFRRHWLCRWHNTTTHHDMHHQHVTGNYSLYFNFWDRVMRTNHREY